MKTLVIGVGNPVRGDDGLGLEAARRLAALRVPGCVVVEASGDAWGLLEAWEDAEHVIVVDAARGTGTPGDVRRIDAVRERVPAALAPASAHGLGVPDAVELARALGRLPRSLVVYVVEGRDFGLGSELSAEVEAALPGVIEAIASEARRG